MQKRTVTQCLAKLYLLRMENHHSKKPGNSGKLSETKFMISKV